MKRMLKKYQPKSLQELRVISWNADSGDEVLRFDYSLGRESVVLDLGAYRGDFAQEIFNRFGARLYLFEPVPEYVDLLRQRFQSNKYVTILPFAMGAKNGAIEFALAEDGTSAYKSGSRLVKAQVRGIRQVLNELDLKQIDLLKINIEGAEFEVLEELIDSGWISKIVNIQVQFHDFVPNALDRLERIREKLGRSHYPTYMYGFVWENWCRRTGNDLESIAMKLLVNADSLRERFHKQAIELEIVRENLNRRTLSWWFRRVRDFMNI